MWIAIRAGLAATLFVTVGCVDHSDRRVRSTGDATKVATDTMDDLNAILIKRAKERFGDSEQFRIIATDAEYPIGTLLRPGSTVAVDYDSCAPAKQPPKVNAPNLFPNTKVTQTVALDFGLDNAVLSALVDAGVKLKNSDAVELKFSKSSVIFLSDRDIQKLATTGQCANALIGNTLLVVRGYVRGQRTFSIQREKDRTSSFGLKNIATFKVDAGSGSNTVAITDDADVGFLQVVSQVSADRIRTGSSLPGSPVIGTPTKVVATVQPPATPNRTGRVYIQRDATDSSGTDRRLAIALAGVGVPIEPRVEAIPTAKMPRLAQVRYFNDQDLSTAQRLLAEVKNVYPGAKIVKIGLPAPQSQFEVWLPRIG